MDLGSLLKGASETFERFGKDVTKEIGLKGPDENGARAEENAPWNSWTDAGESTWDTGEGWEDVDSSNKVPGDVPEVKPTQESSNLSLRSPEDVVEVSPKSVKVGEPTGSPEGKKPGAKFVTGSAEESHVARQEVTVALSASKDQETTTSDDRSEQGSSQTDAVKGIPLEPKGIKDISVAALEARISKLESQLEESRKRTSASERKAFALTRERDSLRRVRDSRSADAELVKEKDRQIAAILAEGEQLSIKIAEKEAAVRKLKSSLHEAEAAREALSSSLATSQAKVEASATRIAQLETSEKAALEAKEAAERRLREIGSETRSLASSSAALEAARAQLESLRKSQAASLESQETRLKSEAQAALEASEAKYKQTVGAHNKTIAELRAHLSQTDETSHRREEELRASVKALQVRCEALESRNESLAAALPNATKPLLQQTRTLQTALAEQQKAAAAAETSLLKRIRAAEQATATAAERARSSEERIGVLTGKIAGLEEQRRLATETLTKESEALRSAQAAAARAELAHQDALEAARSAQSKAIQEKEEAIKDLSKERAERIDASNRADSAIQHLRDQLATMEGELGDATKRIKELESSSVTVRDSDERTWDRVFGRAENEETRLSMGDEEGEDAFSSALEASSNVDGGMYEVERLETALRIKTEEVANLQSQMSSRESAAKALADEVVALTARCEDLRNELGDAPKVKEEMTELRRRHEALLEICGEREEKIGELEADLADVKLMYKEQVTELLLRIENLSGTG